MYKLGSLLPEAQFRDILSKFSINKAQLWLDLVRETIGVPCYDEIKEEFKAREEEQAQKLSEMNCFAVRKVSDSRKTIFQIGIGADKNVRVDGKGVDKLFTEFFSGV